MKKLHFDIDEKPLAKGRPRFRRCGQFVSTYTPKTTSDYEKKVRDAFINQCNQNMSDFIGKISMQIIFKFAPNKSLSKKKKEQLINKSHINKPDLDNLAKSILDGLNGVAFKDDSQIYKLSTEKYYSNDNCISVDIFYEDEE